MTPAEGPRTWTAREDTSRKLDLIIGLLRFGIWCRNQQRARDIERCDIYRRMLAALQGGHDGKA